MITVSSIAYIIDNDDPEAMGRLRLVIPEITGSPPDDILHDSEVALLNGEYEKHITGWVPGVYPNFGWFYVPPVWTAYDTYGNPAKEARRNMVVVGYLNGNYCLPYWFGVLPFNHSVSGNTVPPEGRAAGEYPTGITTCQSKDMSPESGGPYGAVQVIRTMSGLRIEIKEEHGKPETCTFIIKHPSGTYFEINNDGIYTHTVGDNFNKVTKKMGASENEEATDPTGRWYLLADDHIQIDSETAVDIQLEHTQDIPLLQWPFGANRHIVGPPRTSEEKYFNWLNSWIGMLNEYMGEGADAPSD